jgi:hypothetical protein
MSARTSAFPRLSSSSRNVLGSRNSHPQNGAAPDQIVIVDTHAGGHATTPNDLADALQEANPNRHESVSPSGYISGIGY